MITSADIKKLASLSRIALTPAEEDEMAEKITGILGYIEQIKQAGTTTAGREKEPVRNVARPDTNPNETGAQTETIAALFPAREGDSLKVKKIL